MQRKDCINCPLLIVDHHENHICGELHELIENIEWCPELTAENDNELEMRDINE